MIASRVYDNRYIKIKVGTYGKKGSTNFCGLNKPQVGLECKYFTIISIDSLIVYGNKYYPLVYWDNCAYKVVNAQMIDYVDDNLVVESDEIYFLILMNESYKRSITIELI